MNTQDFDQLIALMIDKGYSEVSYEKDGIRLALKLAQQEAALSENDAAFSPLATKPDILCAKAIGILAIHHPDAAENTVSETGEDHEGKAVKAGQAVAFVQSGLCLSAICAPAAGVLGKPLAKAGSIVGFNTPIFEFYPD